MSDSVLSRQNPIVVAECPSTIAPSPSLVKQYIQDALSLEQEAVRLDQLIAEQEAERTTREKSNKKILDDLASAHKKSLDDLAKARAATIAAAIADETAARIIALDATESFKLITTRTEHPYVVIQGSIPEISARISALKTSAIAHRNKLEQWKAIPRQNSSITIFSCIAFLIALAAFWATGQTSVVLILLAVPVVIARQIWATQKAFNSDTSEMLVAAAKLRGLAKQVREVREGTAEKEHQEGTARAIEEYQVRLTSISDQCQHAIDTLNKDYKARNERFRQELATSYATNATSAANASRELRTCSWSEPIWSGWTAASTSPGWLRLGEVIPNMPQFHHYFPSAATISMPLLLDYEHGKGIVIEAGIALKDSRNMAQSAILRLLATVPPAGVKFTFIDPVSLGGNVAGFMGLEQYEPSLIGGKAWSDTRDIERALSEVTSHMETVIQKYLRNDYKSIADYNAIARVKEAYRVVVVFDFPVNFSDSAAKMLTSIMRNGPRCGVFPIVIIDDSKPAPYGFNKQDLERFAVVFRRTATPIPIAEGESSLSDMPFWNDSQTDRTSRLLGEQFEIMDPNDGFQNCRIVFDSPPPKNLTKSILEAIGKGASEAMKVEVTFSDLLIQAEVSDNSWWSASTIDALRVPLGPRGATDIQEMELGTGLAHHCLIVGRPGSGKTTLMHVIITALAMRYSPEELELYLIDFKKGVGFKAYAEADHPLPHARVIAIESEREFGISVLRGLDKELTERGELFRAASGAEKISEYRHNTGNPMPRVLLIADEFQEFFTVEDAIAREASLLLDRIVRQGRAFGIHIILGTQTLAGSYGIGRSTVDQISVRIALQCSEADSRLILGEDNPGARFLSRPGEAIYNSENGQSAANKLFQVATFKDEDKKEVYLARLAAKATNSKTRRKPIVFEGDHPATLELPTDVECLINAEYPQKRKDVNAWLGEPIAIKEPTSARLRRQAGANLIIVTRDEEQGVGVLASAATTLAIQHSDDTCRFVIADYSTADAEWTDFFETFCNKMPHEGDVVRRRQVPEAVKEILQEVEARHSRSSSPPSSLFLIISGLHRARELRKDEDDYGTDSPADNLLKILRDGPEVGVHCLVWADTVSSLTRTAGRKVLAEFGTRAAGVMSNDDSQTLIEDSAAAKIDRPHRMILFDEEQPGVLEKFRPFAIPSQEGLDKLVKRIQEAH